jgi:hypothetical protein
LFFTALTHGLAALTSPAGLTAFITYAVLTALLPVLYGLTKFGDFLDTCVLTLGTPLLTVFLTLSAGRAMVPPHAVHGSVIHAGASEVVSLILLGVLLCLALALVEFANIDTHGLPVYLVGLIALKLFFDADAVAPVYPGWFATFAGYLLVAFFATLLRLVTTEEAGDITAALKRDPDKARSLVRQCLIPALNVIPAIIGVCLYGAATTLR